MLVYDESWVAMGTPPVHQYKEGEMWLDCHRGGSQQVEEQPRTGYGGPGACPLILKQNYSFV